MPRPGLELRPLPDRTRDIIDQAMHASERMVSMRRSFGHDEQMAFVRNPERLLQTPENHLFDIRIRVGVFIDKEALGSGLIGAGQGQMPGSCSHHLDEKDASHRRAGMLQATRSIDSPA